MQRPAAKLLEFKNFWLASLLLCIGATANAQVRFEVVGARALGMGGAFVAVADDSSAVFWNPAGLIHGPLAGLTIAGDRFHFRDQNGPPEPGPFRVSSQSVAFGAWPVGVSYLRVQSAILVQGPDGAVEARALRTGQFGFTVLQSVGDFVVVGTTAKFLRGSAGFSSSGAGSVREVLDAADAVRHGSQGRFDLDIGIVAGTDRVRAAATFKNLLRPRFDTVPAGAVYLERLARIGLSASPRDGLTLALDVDLDTADPVVGLRRTIAVGGEARPWARLHLRAGMRWERADVKRPIGSFGGSVSFREGLWLDGYFTRGRSTSQGFGFALRAGM